MNLLKLALFIVKRRQFGFYRFMNVFFLFLNFKALHNIFRTNETNPEYVLEKLKEVVEEKCVPYKQSE